MRNYYSVLSSDFITPMTIFIETVDVTVYEIRCTDDALEFCHDTNSRGLIEADCPLYAVVPKYPQYSHEVHFIKSYDSAVAVFARFPDLPNHLKASPQVQSDFQRQVSSRHAVYKFSSLLGAFAMGAGHLGYNILLTYSHSEVSPVIHVDLSEHVPLHAMPNKERELLARVLFDCIFDQYGHWTPEHTFVQWCERLWLTTGVKVDTDNVTIYNTQFEDVALQLCRTDAAAAKKIYKMFDMGPCEDEDRLEDEGWSWSPVYIIVPKSPRYPGEVVVIESECEYDTAVAIFDRFPDFRKFIQDAATHISVSKLKLFCLTTRLTAAAFSVHRSSLRDCFLISYREGKALTPKQLFRKVTDPASRKELAQILKEHLPVLDTYTPSHRTYPVVASCDIRRITQLCEEQS